MRDRWKSWGAWWSGDPTGLKTDSTITAPAGYWTRRAQADDDERNLHLPLAGDIARTSAELVFGDTPALKWSDDEDNDPLADAWDDLSQRMGWANSLLEAGEVASAMGGVYLRPQWEASVAAHPLLTIVRPDEAYPEFRFGILTAVTFVTQLTNGDTDTLRWLEHHERGQIRHELWKGTNANIGRVVPLTDHPATQHLAELVDENGAISTLPIRDDGGLLVEYVPNDLPQPLDRQPYGRSDLQGQEAMLDSLDEVYASLMRDVELAAARAIVPAGFLDTVTPQTGGGGILSRYGLSRRGNTTAARRFDPTRKYFTPLPGLETDHEGKATGITTVQPQIRVKEHTEAALHLVEQIVSRAGFAPQTMGMHVEGQVSGTAMRRRDHRSYRTRDRKRRYFRSPLERNAETLMLIHAALFGGVKPTVRPTLEWRETDQADPKETAETIELLRRSGSQSRWQSIKAAHPEWDKDQIQEEWDRLEAEQPTAPVLTGFEPEEPPAPVEE